MRYFIETEPFDGSLPQSIWADTENEAIDVVRDQLRKGDYVGILAEEAGPTGDYDGRRHVFR